MAIKLNRLATDERTGLKKTISENQLSALNERSWSWLFCLVCLVVIFSNLGGAALFEPDEGRNAEKAREILLLGNWVTPYENFLASLDKPIFQVFLKENSLVRFSDAVGMSPRVLSKVDGYLLVTNR